MLRRDATRRSGCCQRCRRWRGAHARTPWRRSIAGAVLGFVGGRAFAVCAGPGDAGAVATQRCRPGRRGIRAAPCWSVRRAAWPPRSWPRCCGPCDHRHRYPSCSGRPVGRGLKYADGLSNLVTQLVGAGVVTECRQPRAGRHRSASTAAGRSRSCSSWRCVAPGRIAHGSQPHAAVSPDAVDLVVLSDYLVADPRMVHDLHRQRVPHLPVRVRDGTGLVGPLVIPGVTSCLGNPKRGITQSEGSPRK
jgi:hypothetical protein